MWLALLVATALAAPSGAQVHTTSRAVVIDGVLDDAAWDEATPVTTFQRFLPSAGGAPDESIAVRFLQDDTTLYVSVRVERTHAPIRARTSPREDIDSDDQIGLYLDPFHDARTGFIFYFNPLGIQQDIRFDNGEWDLRWSTVLRSKGTVDDDGHGFTLEVALPFRSLKYPRAQGEQDWGVMVTRKIPSEGAKYAFPQLVRGHPRMFTQAASLNGVRPPNIGSGVELIPGLTVRYEQSRPTPEAPLQGRWFEPWYDSLRPSLDARVGLGTNVGLVAAVNPDFSQVESDVAPVVLNRRFAWAFPEQRPVFTEGANWLEDDAGTLYTRSLAAPLYVVKVGGREGAWSVGALHALDMAPSSTFHEAGTPGFASEDVTDKWAFNSLVRVRRDLPGAGQIGITLADKRLVRSDLTLAPLGTPHGGSSDTFGIDTTIPIGDRWTVLARHDQSYTRGEVHDSARRGQTDGIGGTNTALSVSRASGKDLGVALGAAFVSDDYRQEMGFRNQSGYFQGNAAVDWTAAPGGRVSTVLPGVEATVFEQISGEHYRTVGVRNDLVIDGIHTLKVGGGYSHRREDQSDVGGWWANLSYAGQIGAAVEWSPSIALAREMDFADLQPTQRTQVQLTASLRPVRSLRVDLLGRWLHFDRPEPRADGVDRTDDLLVRARVQAQFTRTVGLRVIEAFNHVSGHAVDGLAGEPRLETSALLFWQLHPFTAIYAGFAERDALGASARTLERSVFAKVTVWTRL